MKSLAFWCILIVIVALDSASSYSGDLTYYTEWFGNYGSCGLERSKVDQFQVAALSKKWMSGVQNSNNHPLCAADKCIRVDGLLGSVILKISDTCMGCKDYDVDIADTVFPLLDNINLGRVPVTWNFVDCNSNSPGLVLVSTVSI